MLLEQIFQNQRVITTIYSVRWYPDKLQIIRPDGKTEICIPRIGEVFIVWDGPREVCRIGGKTLDEITTQEWYAIYEEYTHQTPTYKKGGRDVEYIAFQEWKQKQIEEYKCTTN